MFTVRLLSNEVCGGSIGCEECSTVHKVVCLQLSLAPNDTHKLRELEKCIHHTSRIIHEGKCGLKHYKNTQAMNAMNMKNNMVGARASTLDFGFTQQSTRGSGGC